MRLFFSSVLVLFMFILFYILMEFSYCRFASKDPFDIATCGHSQVAQVSPKAENGPWEVHDRYLGIWSLQHLPWLSMLSTLSESYTPQK